MAMQSCKAHGRGRAPAADILCCANSKIYAWAYIQEIKRKANVLVYASRYWFELLASRHMYIDTHWPILGQLQIAQLQAHERSQSGHPFLHSFHTIRCTNEFMNVTTGDGKLSRRGLQSHGGNKGECLPARWKQRRVFASGTTGKPGNRR